MSYAIRIHPDLGLAAFRFQGAVSVAQATRAFLDYIRMPGFDPTHLMLSDARQVTSVEADFHRIFYHVANLLPHLGQFPKGSRSLLLLNGEPALGHIQTLSKVLSWSSHIRMTSTQSEREAMALVAQTHPAAASQPMESLMPALSTAAAAAR